MSFMQQVNGFWNSLVSHKVPAASLVRLLESEPFARAAQERCNAAVAHPIEVPVKRGKRRIKGHIHLYGSNHFHPLHARTTAQAFEAVRPDAVAVEALDTEMAMHQRHFDTFGELYQVRHPSAPLPRSRTSWGRSLSGGSLSTPAAFVKALPRA